VLVPGDRWWLDSLLNSHCMMLVGVSARVLVMEAFSSVPNMVAPDIPTRGLCFPMDYFISLFSRMPCHLKCFETVNETSTLGSTRLLGALNQLKKRRTSMIWALN
jgi:hypothetical protein